jgi:putative holliday junction resolvase
MMEKGASIILGIDYGEARCGLALADDEVRIASGFCVLENDEKMFQNLESIIDENHISIVVIGKTSGPMGRRMEKLRKMEDFISQKGLKIIYQEEMFTTIDAQRSLKEKGSKNISKGDDIQAARIILQDWLDENTG